MKQNRSSLVGTLALAACSLPSVVHACPMCFAGGNQNQDAFLYGSLFLMVVPVSAIGGLAYWAYKRIRAAEDGSLVSHESVANPTSEPSAGAPSAGVVLHMAPRR